MAVYIGNRKKVAIAIVGLVSLVCLWNSDIVEEAYIQTYIAARKFTTPAFNTLATPSHHPTTKERKSFILLVSVWKYKLIVHYIPYS